MGGAQRVDVSLVLLAKGAQLGLLALDLPIAFNQLSLLHADDLLVLAQLLATLLETGLLLLDRAALLLHHGRQLGDAQRQRIALLDVQLYDGHGVPFSRAVMATSLAGEVASSESAAGAASWCSSG